MRETRPRLLPPAAEGGMPSMTDEGEPPQDVSASTSSASAWHSRSTASTARPGRARQPGGRPGRRGWGLRPALPSMRPRRRARRRAWRGRSASARPSAASLRRRGAGSTSAAGGGRRGAGVGTGSGIGRAKGEPKVRMRGTPRGGGRTSPGGKLFGGSKSRKAGCRAPAVAPPAATMSGRGRGASASPRAAITINRRAAASAGRSSASAALRRLRGINPPSPQPSSATMRRQWPAAPCGCGGWRAGSPWGGEMGAEWWNIKANIPIICHNSPTAAFPAPRAEPTLGRASPAGSARAHCHGQNAP